MNTIKKSPFGQVQVHVRIITYIWIKISTNENLLSIRSFDLAKLFFKIPLKKSDLGTHILSQNYKTHYKFY